MVEGLFQWLDAFKNSNMVRAAFGEPYDAAGRTVIPVARVSYALRAEGEFEGEGPQPGAKAEGGGLLQPRSRCYVRPIALVSVGSEGVRVHEITDRSSLALVGAGVLALASALVWRFARGRGG